MLMVGNLYKRAPVYLAFGAASLFSAQNSEGQNRYGADRDLGYEVYSMKRELDATNGRVSKLEGDVKAIRSQFPSAGGHVSYRGGDVAPTPTSRRSGEGLYHRVQAGETLSSISRRFEIGVDRLVAENRITNPNALQIGQEIYIPGRKGSAAAPRADSPTAGGAGAAPQAGGEHTVRAGETLSAIARRYGVTTTAIASANRLTNPNALQIGQQLQIPGGAVGTYAERKPPSPQPAPPAPAPRENRNDEIVAPDGHGFYQVEKGDTLHSIAVSFGTNTRELRRLNDIKDDSLHVGDYLLVPVPDESLYES